VLPFYGALLFCIGSTLMMFVMSWAKTGLSSTLGQLHDFVIIPYWGLVSAMGAIYLVLPMGLLCQFIMKRLASE
ncbi:MAG: hypothetical protein ACREIQ_08685, partial [Nitrospiria bacterium]